MYQQPLTFDHDHVDVDGADDRLGESLSSLQHIWDFPRWHHVVRFGSKRHQLPNGHSWAGKKNKTHTRTLANTDSLHENLQKMNI